MKNKYNNQKVRFENLTFDSIREKNRYIYLSNLQEKGVIYGLELQPKYELIPAQRINGKVVERAVAYTADFLYLHNGRLVVEDVKISKKLLPKEFVIKRKLMLHIHGIRISEVYKPTQEI